MIPQISQAPGVVQLVLNFLQVLEQQGFTGDTATSYADRLTMATDNSVYQLLPDAVIFPRSTADVALLARVAAEPRFKSLIFTPRGGGTGTNGQALNGGIIVDMSRYMNRIIEINPEEGWVRVEAGVIKDQLNQFLKPYGYFFAPELSTSNRATLGGMINTDASGQGSLVYGKTSDHVLGLRAVLMGGDILDTQAVPVALAETLGNTPSTVGRIYNTVYQRCKAQRDLIIDKFPKLNRFLTGYDLRHVFNDEMSEFDLTRILTGSEGTLAFITEARLDITRLPKVRRLVNVKYDSFEPELCILDESDSGLDIDALKIVSQGVNALRDGKRAFIIVTHYQRILDYIKPDYVHVLYQGRIVKSGDFSLVKQLEEQGYGWLTEQQ